MNNFETVKDGYVCVEIKTLTISQRIVTETEFIVASILEFWKNDQQETDNPK